MDMTADLELEPDVVAALNKGRKIDAIKQLREIRGIGLKEAKEIIDAYSASHPLNSTGPVQRSNSANGLVLMIIVGIAAYFLLNFITQ